MPGFTNWTKLAALTGFVIPGAGHVFLGRFARGLVLFFWFAFFVNGSAVAPVFETHGVRVDPRGFLAAAGLIWLYSTLDLLRILIWRNRKALEEKKREKFLSAFGFYLKGEYGRARSKLRSVLGMDRDDADAHFHIAMTFKREGMKRLARKHFRLALSVDPFRKWAEEVRRELRDV